MWKVLLFACMFLSPAHLLRAQDGPTHSITEIYKLLQKSGADTSKVNLLCEAALVYIWRPDMKKNDFDSAQYFITRAIDLANSLNDAGSQARCYALWSQLYRENNEKEKGKNYLNRAIAIFERHGPKEKLGDAWFEMTHYYDVYSDSEWNFKVKYAELGVSMYRESGSKLKLAGALKHLGDFYQVKDKDSIALERLHESLAVYKSIGYNQVQGVYDLMGSIHLYHHEYHHALKYGLLAVEVAEKYNTGGAELGTIYNHLGFTYEQLSRYEEAVSYYNRSLSIVLEHKDFYFAKFVAINKMNSLLQLRKQKELLTFIESVRFLFESENTRLWAAFHSGNILAYLLSNDHQRAQPYVDRLIRVVGDTNNLFVRRSLYNAVIPYYFAAGKYKQMYQYLSANDSTCRQLKQFSGLADNYLWWYKADSALGNHISAIGQYKSYKEASDSVQRFQANQQMNELMVQHETFKKDQELDLKETNIRSLTNQSKLQREQLRQAKLVRNLTYGLAALFVIIAALLLYGYRSKQRSNKILEAHQLEINDKNELLQHVVNQKEKLLVEKEWLLKEVHHRVKNNMQIVMSLLNTQSAYLENDALTAIKESQHRMQAMSLIHQRLYLADNVAAINMRNYIRELSGYLRDSYDSGRNIRYNLDIEDIELDVSQAVPVGFILNESITNTIKYAFPDGRNGTIDIVMKKITECKILLKIGDDGIGLLRGIDTGKKHSFGMNLIRGLVAQLEGTLNITSEKGLIIRIEFPQKKFIKAVTENESLII